MPESSRDGQGMGWGWWLSKLVSQTGVTGWAGRQVGGLPGHAFRVNTCGSSPQAHAFSAAQWVWLGLARHADRYMGETA